MSSSSQRQSKDVPRCSLPWRRSARTRKPSLSKRSRTQKRVSEKTADSYENYPDALHSARVVSPGSETGRTYSTLAKAAGVSTPVNSMSPNEKAWLPSPPPPVPEKKLRIDTSFLDTPAPRSQLGQSASPQMSSSTSFFSPVARAGTPLTPLSAGGSFLRSRAGSMSAKAPPPPLTIPAFARKGSLPCLDLRPPPAHIDHRFRSSSLPHNSLLPVPNMYIKQTGSLVKLDDPPSAVLPPRHPTPQEELLEASGHRTGSRPSTGASRPGTGNSVARASSILSVSQDTQARRTEMARKIANQDQIAINVQHASHAINSPRRSEVDSVPHDSVQTPRRDTWQSQNPMHGQTLFSGNTEKSFDLTSVPFRLGNAPAASDTILTKILAPSTLAVAKPPLSPIQKASRQHISTTASIKSARSSKGSLRKRSTPTAQAAILTQSPRQPSTSLAHLLEPEPRPRDFPWKAISVAEAKKTCSPKQLQQIILQSMREYGSTQKHALILENFGAIPLEVEQCNQRTQELEEAHKNELALRKTLLKKHVACLGVLNGEQGARFGESLVSAVSRSDRLAQEACQLRDHMAKVEHLRNSHWRAAASLSLARLNASYLKAKDRVKQQDDELNTLRSERDAALAEVKRLRATRSSTLSMSQLSESATPFSGGFDFASFPVPPLATDKLGTQFLSPPVSRKNTGRQIRSPPLSPAPETPSSASHHYDKVVSSPPPPPAATFKELPPLVMPDYRFPALTATNDDFGTAFCSLPTPPISEVSASPSPSTLPSSRFRTFTYKVFGGIEKSQSTPPPDSDLAWARLTDSPTPHVGRAMSTPILDPYADPFSPEVETLRFMPPSMHLSGAMDDEARSLRSSFDRRSVRDPAERIGTSGPRQTSEANDLHQP